MHLEVVREASGQDRGAGATKLIRQILLLLPVLRHRSLLRQHGPQLRDVHERHLQPEMPLLPHGQILEHKPQPAHALGIIQQRRRDRHTPDQIPRITPRVRLREAIFLRRLAIGILHAAAEGERRLHGLAAGPHHPPHLLDLGRGREGRRRRHRDGRGVAVAGVFDEVGGAGAVGPPEVHVQDEVHVGGFGVVDFLVGVEVADDEADTGGRGDGTAVLWKWISTESPLEGHQRIDTLEVLQMVMSGGWSCACEGHLLCLQSHTSALFLAAARYLARIPNYLVGRCMGSCRFAAARVPGRTGAVGPVEGVLDIAPC